MPEPQILNLTATLNTRVEAILTKLVDFASDPRVTYEIITGLIEPNPGDQPVPCFQILLIIPSPVLGTTMHNLSNPILGPMAVPDETLENLLRGTLESMWEERDRILREGP